MNIDDLVSKFSSSTEKQQRLIFNSLFIITNKLQTIFDNHIPELSLKQFLLLSTVRQSEAPLTFTQLGELLGCSRQNIKKIADVLMKKGFITIEKSPADPRAMYICPTGKADTYFQTDFPKYQGELKYLFNVYTEDEVKTLFTLLSMLYKGIEHFETRIADKKK